MNKTQKECQSVLLKEGIDINSQIDFEVNGKIHTLSFSYILDVYMEASQESQLVFLTSLQKSIDAKDMGVDRFFEGMGQLLLMTHLSTKFDI